jgi:putative ABC transport system ATP-binding protein
MNKNKLSIEQKKELKDKIRQAKEIKKVNKKPKGKVQIENKPGNIIEIINMCKQYSNRTEIFTAINNVNLEIKEGDFTVILGPSGSGKTTLLNCVSGLDRPTSGEIVINNTNIAALKDSELTKFRRNNIGFIFQSYNLLPTLNVLENAKIGQVLQADKSKRISLDEIFNDIGMEENKNKRVDEISGGQQQRVSIARAVSKNPKIIFADEPTGALDQNTARKVLKIFLDLNKKYKTTVVLVTHDRDISKLGNKIIHVKNNQIHQVLDNNPITIEDI